MKRLKTFFIYFMVFIAFYILTDILVSVSLATSYKPMTCTKNDTNGYTVEISNAKSTNVSGYIEGTIKKNEDEQNYDKYMQIDFYSRYGNCLGRKYIDISNIANGQSNNFKVNFEYSNIETYQISTINEVNDLTNVQHKLINKGYFTVGLVGALIILYYVI